MVKGKDPLSNGGATGDHRVEDTRITESSESSRIRLDIEQTRAEMDRTMSELGEQLHPRRLLDECVALFRSGEGGEEARRLARQAGRKFLEKVKEHPVGTALIGAGVAYIMFFEKDQNRADGLDEFVSDPDIAGCGCGPESTANYVTGGSIESYEGLDAEGRKRSSVGEKLAGAKQTLAGAAGSAAGSVKGATASAARSVGQAASSAAHGVAEAASSAAGKVGEKVSGAAMRARESLSSMKEKTSAMVGDAACSVGDKARHMGHRVSQGMSEAGHIARVKAGDLGQQIRQGYDTGRQRAVEVSDEHPIAVGAALLGLGLLVGLALPRTRREDEWMGDQSDELKDRARQTGKELVHRGMHVAQVATERTVDEAQREGLTPSALIDKAKRVAADVKNAVNQAAEREELNPSLLGEKVKTVAERAKEAAINEVEQQKNSEGADTADVAAHRI